VFYTGGGGFVPQPFPFQAEGPGTTTWSSEGTHFSFQDLFGMGDPDGEMGGIDLSSILEQMLGGRKFGGGVGGPASSSMPFTSTGPRSRARKMYRSAKQQQPVTRYFYCSLEELSKGCTKKLKVTHSIPDADEDDSFIKGRSASSTRIESKIYEIQVKPGWKNGTKVRFPATKSGFPPMIFVLKEKPHPYLKRQVNDLLWVCKLTSKQAEKGANLKVPLPDGSTTELTTTDRAPISLGDVIILRGKGMPIKGGPERGDLVIEFQIISDKNENKERNVKL